MDRQTALGSETQQEPKFSVPVLTVIVPIPAVATLKDSETTLPSTADISFACCHEAWPNYGEGRENRPLSNKTHKHKFPAVVPRFLAVLFCVFSSTPRENGPQQKKRQLLDPSAKTWDNSPNMCMFSHIFKGLQGHHPTAQPSARLSGEICLSEGSQGPLRGSLRGFCGVSPGLCGGPRDFPSLVTLSLWNLGTSWTSSLSRKSASTRTGILGWECHATQSSVQAASLFIVTQH